MTKQSESAPTHESTRANAFVTILWIGLVAGTLDITDSLIFNHLAGSLQPGLSIHRSGIARYAIS